VEYLPRELKGSLPTLEELEELSRFARQHRSRDARNAITEVPLERLNCHTQHLGMFILYLSQQDVQEETIGRSSS
jgi:hypothetical protein